MKYDINNFKFQIICVCFDEDCNKFEKEYIKKFNTISPNGYNLMDGGNNSRHHPETIELIRKNLKGRVTCPMTDDIKRKISESSKGHKVSEETRNKISNTLKIKIQSEENIQKRINARKNISEENKLKINTALLIGVEANKKKVAQYNNQFKLIKVYDSMCEASRETKICQRTISKVCNNIKYCKTAGGFIWKFV
jgi:group I intron endonuclease